jgi:hypothetical protein
MKINEFKVDEGLHDLINAVNRHMGGSGESDSSRDARVNSRAQQGFINKFVTMIIQSVDGGLGRTIDPNPNAMPVRQPTAESKYKKLSSLFEQIVRESPAYPDTISTYIIQAFLQYMENVQGLNTIMPNVKKLANQAQRTYATNKGKDALVDLAKLGWTASMAQRKASSSTRQPPTPRPGWSKVVTLGGKNYAKGPRGWYTITGSRYTVAPAALTPSLDALLTTS